MSIVTPTKTFLETQVGKMAVNFLLLQDSVHCILCNPSLCHVQARLHSVLFLGLTEDHSKVFLCMTPMSEIIALRARSYPIQVFLWVSKCLCTK